jgi:two-component system, OmpR family, sensor histidine kinase BaeS
MGLFMGLFFGLVFVVSALAQLIVSGALGVHGHGRAVGGVAGLALLILLFVVAARSARRMAAPVDDVMEAADRVAAGDYGARVPARGPGDMRRLARSFNAMAGRLASNEQRRRELFADIAHELRTPLSVLRGDLEAIVDGIYPADEAHLRPLLDETTVMARLLEDLRTLSMAEAGVLELHREPTDPAALAADALAPLRARARESGVALDVQAPSDLGAIEIDPIRIGEVLANLLSNALTHTPAGGTVVVQVSRDATGVAFAVSDTGPGIAPDQLPHVFERFVRSSDSTGSGLGLAIAKRLVEAHGGTITAETGQGGGTTVRFVLPKSET